MCCSIICPSTADREHVSSVTFHTHVWHQCKYVENLAWRERDRLPAPAQPSRAWCSQGEPVMDCLVAAFFWKLWCKFDRALLTNVLLRL